MFTKAIAPQTIGASRVKSGNDRSNRKSRSRLGALVPLFFLLIGIVPSTQAALVGDTVVFDDVSLGMWGSPTVQSGDTLLFSPIGFGASAVGGPSVVDAKGEVTFNIVAQPGYQITGFHFFEQGSSLLLGSSQTYVTARLLAGGTPILDISFPEGKRFLGPDVVGSPDPAAEPGWEAEALVNLSSPVQSLHIKVGNIFVAQAFYDIFDYASIDMDQAWFQVETTVVPLPPAVLLFGSALVFMVGIGRRRSRPVA